MSNKRQRQKRAKRTHEAKRAREARTATQRERSAEGRARVHYGYWVAGVAAAVAVVLVLVVAGATLSSDSSSDPGRAPETRGPREQPAAPAAQAHIEADHSRFLTDAITLVARREAVIHFQNSDSLQHNVSVYPEADGGVPIFTGDIIEGGSATAYELRAPAAGEYLFVCDVHPFMRGRVIVKSA